MIPTKFRWQPCLLTDRDEKSNRGPSIYRCFLPSFGSFGQVVSEKILKIQPIRNKNCLWRPCLVMDHNEICTLGREATKDASYHVSVPLAKRFQRKRLFRNQPIGNKNCLWQPCLLMNRNEMSNLYTGPSKDTPYQVSIHLAKRFQRRRFFQKSTNQKQECPVVAMFVNGSCFLPSFRSFGQAV